MALLGTSRTSGGRKKSLVSQLIINEFVFLKIFKIFKTITLEIKKSYYSKATSRLHLRQSSIK
jgi:hypothetical protein